MSLVARQALGPVARGLLAGVITEWFTFRGLTSLLFGVTSRDPLVIVGSAAVLLVTATLATLLPARRAARIDPAEALRRS